MSHLWIQEICVAQAMDPGDLHANRGATPFIHLPLLFAAERTQFTSTFIPSLEEPLQVVDLTVRPIPHTGKRHPYAALVHHLG